MTRSCLPGVDRCQVVLRGDTRLDCGDRPDVCTVAEVHGLCQGGRKEVTLRLAPNTRAPIAHLIVQPVSRVGGGIVLVMGDRLNGTLYLLYNYRRRRYKNLQFALR